jgi:hypothetical protein
MDRAEAIEKQPVAPDCLGRKFVTTATRAHVEGIYPRTLERMQDGRRGAGASK